MTSKLGYIAMKTSELEWSDGSELLKLPPGVMAKLLVDDPDTNMRALLVKFPPGYQEPAHTHAGTHATVVLEGKMVMGGKTLGPDDACYGPNDVEHEPILYPEGCVIFEIFQGDIARQPLPAGRSATAGQSAGIGFLTLPYSEAQWQYGPQYNKLPPGTEIAMLVDDRARDLKVWMTRFVPGYHEPRHIHGGTAPGTVLYGKQIVAGKTLERGDFRYSGPWLEHGPFDYPEHCVVFSMFQGDIAHKY